MDVEAHLPVPLAMSAVRYEILVGELLRVVLRPDPSRTTKIGNARLRANPRPGEDHETSRPRQQLCRALNGRGHREIVSPRGAAVNHACDRRYDRNCHFVIVQTSPQFSPSLRTTDGSNPECM